MQMRTRPDAARFSFTIGLQAMQRPDRLLSSVEAHMDTERNTAYRLYTRLPRSVLHALFFLPWLLILCWMAALSWWLTDDAFISFRYARNLLEGHGLVFNPGERVEGYTNFLWTLELAGIWGLFGVRPEHSAPWLSVIFTFGTLVTMLYWVARMPSLRHRGLVAWMSLGLVCGSATFAVWTSAGGLETRQFTFFIVAAVVLLSVHRGSRPGLLSASVSLGLASLTRPEGVLIAGCCIGWFVLQSMTETPETDGRGAEGVRAARAVAVIVQMLKRIDWRGFACLVLPFAVMAGAHLLFRVLYYGDILPNTYHAKFVRPWWDMGMRYYAAAGLETGLYILAPLAATGAWLRWKSHRDSIYALVLLFIALHAFYVMRLGGDFFEWRPLDFYWPLLAVPTSEGIAWTGAKASSAFGRVAPALLRFQWIAPVAFALLIFASVLFYSSAMQFAMLTRLADTGRVAHFSTIKLDHQDSGYLFVAPGMDYLYQINEGLRAKMAPHFIGWKFNKHRQEMLAGKTESASYEDALRGKMPEDAMTVHGVLGVRGYYMHNIQIVDYYGLADKTIARNLEVPINEKRAMAHDRRPPYGYLEQRGVNMSIWPPARSEAEALERGRYALRLEEDLWMPFNAVDHQWVQDSFGGLELASVHDGASAVDVMDGIVGDREPEIRSDFYDVHIVGDSVVYVKSPCIWDDVQYPFFLHVAQQPRLELPAERQALGFYELDFGFWDTYVAADIGVCVATVDLPSYEIANIKTGQLQGLDVVWDGSYSMYTVGAFDAVTELRRHGRQPEISSDYDVFVDGGNLVYHKQPCYQQDIDARFFLHVVPANTADLPLERRESGFDNLDFSLWQKGGRVGHECVARVRLPKYEIAEIRTGQFTLEGRIWEAVIEVADAASGIWVR